MKSAIDAILNDLLRGNDVRRGRGMAQKSLDLIEHCRGILAEIHPTTVRGVAYQLFTRGLIENMGLACVRKVSRMLVTAREKEMIPWEWIVSLGGPEFISAASILALAITPPRKRPALLMRPRSSATWARRF
jgi:hypothetical protein